MTFTSDGQTLSGKELAEKINDAFISVTQHLNPLSYVPDSTHTEDGQSEILSEFIISEIDVYNKLSTISCSKAPGPDAIPNWVLKDYSSILALPIASSFNASIQQASIPAIWKKADVISIQKTKVLTDINTDLRPISLTPTLEKICERFVADWLIRSIIHKLDTRQFGSLKGSSTTHALLSLVHHILSETDGSKDVIRIFLLDIAKAFDHIDHNVLLLIKLSSMDIPPTIINWIRDFLTGREQRVRVGSCVSDWKKINGGVPQGTVLGPILFLVMINDLLEDWKDRWKYVDDSTVAESIRPNCASALQDLVDYISTWTVNNKMMLNISKCKEVVIDFAKEKRTFQPLFVDGIPINRVESARILGLTVQNNMKWNLHVDHIVTKASKRLYLLRLLKRSSADVKTLMTVYITIIRPTLEYACEVWHFNIPDFLCADIERIQKRALRIILPSLTYREALSITGITTLKDRRESLCSTFFNKNRQNDKLVELFPELSSVGYDLRSIRTFKNYSYKTDRFKNSFLPQVIS